MFLNNILRHQLQSSSKKISGDESTINMFRILKEALFEASFYSLLEISDHVEQNSDLIMLFRNLKWTDLPFPSQSVICIVSTLPSVGLHQAVYFIWKQQKSSGHDSENVMLITNLREREKTIYSESTRKLVKQKLKNLGITKAYQANINLRDLLGDEGSLHNERDEAELEKV